MEIFSMGKKNKLRIAAGERRPLWVTLAEAVAIRRLFGDRCPPSLERQLDAVEDLFTDAALRLEEARIVAAANGFWEEDKTAADPHSDAGKKKRNKEIDCLPAAEVIELMRRIAETNQEGPLPQKLF